jgi:hypothetical protein
MSGLPRQIRTLVAVFALVFACALPGHALADTSTGGASPDDPQFQPHGTAMLLPNGQAIAPTDAPPEVAAIIEAGNKIATMPYIYGGGHNAKFSGRGYDCSGSVSYALHGGKFLESPLPSGAMETWAEPGEGRWITVYANGGHAYAVIAGIRFDTSGDEGGETGPRWHTELRDNIGYVARHPAGY